MLMLATIFCSMRYRRSFGSDHCFMPMSASGEDSATSAICSRSSMAKVRGERVWNQGYQVMPSMPSSLNRCMICRTHCAEQPTIAAMSRSQGWPTASRMIRALLLFTALRLCFFRRRNLTFSYGRTGRTLTVSFMGHLRGTKTTHSPLEMSYSDPLIAAARNLTYFNGLRHESYQLKTALAAFDLGRLSPAEWSVIKEHVAGCDACCRQLEGVTPDPLVRLMQAA